MFVSEGCPTELRRKRENGAWGATVTHTHKDQHTGKKVEDVKVNEGGTFPPEEMVMEPTEIGSVGTSRGVTCNLGNYESARVDIWCSLPTRVDKVDETYQKCEDFCSKKLQEEVKKIRDQAEK